MQQELAVINGNTGFVSRLHRKLNAGMHNMRIAHNVRNKNGYKTFYLLKDGSVVSHREWHQLGSPNYVVVGSKSGCEGHWARIINLQ